MARNSVTQDRGIVRYLRPSVIVTLLCLLYAVIIAVSAGHTLVWVTPAAKLSPSEIEPYAYSDWGYDGFYVYLMAYDPLESPQYIDAPAYRFQRALLPAATRLLAFGNADTVQHMLLALNLLALAAGTRALEYLIVQAGYNPWFAVGYALSLPAFGSARLAMTEPLAYGLVLIGIVLMQRQRVIPAAVIFALAAITKETTLFFPAAFGFLLLYRRQWRQAFAFGLIVLLPFIIWQVMIYGYFLEWGVGSGGATDTGFELLPFGAIVTVFQEAGPLGGLAVMSILAPAVVLPVFWGYYQCWYDYRNGQWTAQTQVLLANLLIMPFVPFSTFAEPIAIFRFIAGMQIAIIWYAAGKQRERALFYSTLWLFTGALAVSSDYFVLSG